MRFAQLEKKRIEATPGAVGFCPACGAQLVAKCGTKNIWHWAHRGRRHCDHWWEPETEWHRSWKDRFPADWQEVPGRDADGELHIADVKAPSGFAVEFQHSAIKWEEARKRTLFHAPMIWVVDGLRRKTDKRQFDKAIRSDRGYEIDGRTRWQFSPFELRLIGEWWELGAIVAFDFGGDDVWLMAGRNFATGIGFWYEKDKLVEHVHLGTRIPRVVFSRTRGRRKKIVERYHTVPHSVLT